MTTLEQRLQQRRMRNGSHLAHSTSLAYEYHSGFDFEDSNNKKIVELVKKDVELFAKKPNEEELTKILKDKAKVLNLPLSRNELDARIESYVRDVHGYELIDPLMKKEGITDIRIVGDKYIVFWYKGIQYRHDVNFKSKRELREWWERRLKHTPFTFNRADARLDAYLLDGSRIHIKDEVTGTSRYDANNKYIFDECPIVTIRRFGGFRRLHELFSLDENGNVIEEKRTEAIGPRWAFHLMKLFASLGLHHLICGNTGSGKTTTANALSEYAASIVIPKPAKHRHPDLHFGQPMAVNAAMLAVEEAPESQPYFDGLILRAWDRLKNADDQGEINMEINLKDALRMYVQIIFIGEMRTPPIVGMFREAVLMGNKLVYSTYHTQNTWDGAYRFEQQLAVAPGTGGREIARFDTSRILNALFYQERVGSRIRLKEILEITGLDLTNNYTFKEVSKWVTTGRNDEGMVDGKLVYCGVSDRTKNLCMQYGVMDQLQQIEELAKEDGLYEPS